jgi:hypothetical protein
MRYLWTLLLMVSMGLLSWGAAQGARPDLFDLKKSQQELEVMKGILSTTLNFVLKELRDSSTGKAERDEVQVYKDFTVHGPWGGSRLSAFYLYGQGATFIIPVSSLRYAKDKPGKALGASDTDLLRLDAELEALRALQLDEQLDKQVELDKQIELLDAQLVNLDIQEQELATHQAEMTRGFLAGVPGGVPGGIVGGVPGGVGGGIPGGERGPAKVRSKPAKPVAQAAPQPPQAPQPSPAPRSPQREEEVRKRVEDLQRSVVKRREEAELKRKQLLERLAQIKIYLIEALANHGDSLTHVKPNEFINLVLTAEEGAAKVFNLADSEGESSHREVMSVQKSVITEYKAGRLTLDAFKQKVLQYNN